jgi:hypothetical protein
MDDTTRLKYLSMALVVFGLIFVFGVFTMMTIWPAGWAWEPRQAEYEQMIVGVYVVLGLFLLRASRDPLRHLSLIWFTAWSSLVHGGVMLVHALRDPVEKANLIGDIPALFLVAIVLMILTPRSGSAGSYT